MLASSIVVTTSTNGTCDRITLYFLRRHVGDRPHQQAAGAAAKRGHAIRRGIAFLHQEIGDVDEVGEGVLLVQQLAILVPAAAHFLAAADVGDGVEPCRDRAG
jgi:hypothetical protein